MFFPQPQQPPPQLQMQPQSEFKPSTTWLRWEKRQKFSFLIACGLSSLAATNLIRIYPAYFWLYAIVQIVAIVFFLFFPDKRLGSLAIGAGILLASWEFIATFKFQQWHLAIAGAVLALCLITLAALGRKGGK